ncbi:hypothetical protein E2C01_020849 [Portunus trituberculatus]|uniref:Uncharacterized protein n=1 Tax=Portunus trituberculatus TaxID=210409 RepID=A0A5B7E106_PORTR|nr:hypothetical protein [Portunus trituberculatus]
MKLVAEKRGKKLLVVVATFKGKLRDDYVDESYRHEELNSGTSCDAEWLLTFTKNMLRNAEKDGMRSLPHAVPHQSSVHNYHRVHINIVISSVTSRRPQHI